MKMLRLVAAGTVLVALALGAARAWATPGAGIVGGPIVARGSAEQNVVIGVPVRRR